MTLLPRPSYSPDLTPLVISRMKKDLKGKRFTENPKAKRKSKDALEGVQKDEHERCFQQWKTRLNEVINFN